MGPTPFAPEEIADGDSGEEPRIPEVDLDEDDLENSLSLAAIESELKPKVLETFDRIAATYKRLRRLQDQDIENRLRNENPGYSVRLRAMQTFSDRGLPTSPVVVAPPRSQTLLQARTMHEPCLCPTKLPGSRASQA